VSTTPLMSTYYDIDAILTDAQVSMFLVRFADAFQIKGRRSIGLD
jgi:hypothetical protein